MPLTASATGQTIATIFLLHTLWGTLKVKYREAKVNMHVFDIQRNNFEVRCTLNPKMVYLIKGD